MSKVDTQNKVISL